MGAVMNVPGRLERLCSWKPRETTQRGRGQGNSWFDRGLVV